MNQLRIVRNLAILLLGAILCLNAPLLLASPTQSQSFGNESRFVKDVSSQEFSVLLRHPGSNQLFALDVKGKSVFIIDGDGESAQKISLPGAPVDVSFSPDLKVAVISMRNAGVGFLNLDNLSLDTLDLSRDVASTVFAPNGFLYVSTFANTNWIHQVNAETGEIVRTFGIGKDLNKRLFAGTLLKLDAPGSALFAGERSTSPAAVYKFDVSSDAPSFLGQNERGEIGSSLKDFVVATLSGDIYMASGSQYGLQWISGETLRLRRLLSSSPYPVSAKLTSNEDLAFTVSTSTSKYELYQFNAERAMAMARYDTYSRQGYSTTEVPDRGFEVNSDGTKAFLFIRATSSGDPFRLQVFDVPQSLAGDMNCDLAVNFNDIDPFVSALKDKASYEKNYPDCDWFRGDTDTDGNITVGDVAGFVELLKG